MICPCCKTEVYGSGVVAIDTKGERHPFHGNCWTDVVTGWSGGPVPLGMSTLEVYKNNFSKVGIDFAGVQPSMNGELN